MYQQHDSHFKVCRQWYMVLQGCGGRGERSEDLRHRTWLQCKERAGTWLRFSFASQTTNKNNWKYFIPGFITSLFISLSLFTCFVLAFCLLCFFFSLFFAAELNMIDYPAWPRRHARPLKQKTSSGCFEAAGNRRNVFSMTNERQREFTKWEQSLNRENTL